MAVEGLSSPAESPTTINRALALTVLGALALGGINSALLLSVDGTIETKHWLASVMLWVSVYPGWRHFFYKERQIPFLPVMTVFYFFAYGMPAFSATLRVKHMVVDPGSVGDAVELALAGELLLLAAFYLVKFEQLQLRVRLPLDLERVAPQLLIVAWLCELLRVSLLNVNVTDAAAQWVSFLGGLPVVLMGALLLLRLRGRLSTLNSVAAIPLLVLTLLTDFSTTSIAVPATTLILLLFVYVAERGKVPVVAIVVGAAVLIAALGIKQEYRYLLSRQTDGALTTRVSLFAGLMSGVSQSKKMKEAGNTAHDRVDHLGAFAHVIARTPASIPYWGGETYQSLFTTWIPRVLYPDKPKKGLGQEYGHRYRFIAPWDTGTSINLEQTVEMYANFGLEGVLVGMFLMGLLYRLTYRLVNHPDGGDGAMLIAANTFRVMLNIESDFSLVFGGIVQAGLLLSVVLWLLARPVKSQ
jgi:hypothetical protein